MIEPELSKPWPESPMAFVRLNGRLIGYVMRSPYLGFLAFRIGEAASVATRSTELDAARALVQSDDTPGELPDQHGRRRHPRS